MNAAEIAVRCCIAGGGPAGMMLGFLLARAGIPVLVLEKHADFLRDFRGDTIHPSTLEVMHELGLLDEFLRRPHQEVKTLGAQIGDEFLQIADFRHLPTHCRFVAFMPQWDFLDFLAEQAKRYPGFQLRMEADVRELIVEGERVTGLRATTQDGELKVSADLVVAADGRIFVMLNRGEYWQCAFVIPKGGYDEICHRGLTALREEITTLVPFFRDRVDELSDWSDVKLLSVAVDRLRVWHRPGLLCIGDAAHAMSPIGGVGIN